jgi:uncharacterized protein (DUF58 family)
MPAAATSDNDARLTRILKRVRRIELLTRGMVKEILGGQYHSRFKGQGIEFDDFREYQAGDDVRFLDWNVTARMNEPFVRKYVEERELTVMLCVDVSGSGDYGSHDDTKRERAAEIAAVFAFSAVQNQDKVGVTLFSDQVEEYLIPARTSNRRWSSLWAASPTGRSSCLSRTSSRLLTLGRKPSAPPRRSTMWSSRMSPILASWNFRMSAEWCCKTPKRAKKCS